MKNYNINIKFLYYFLIIFIFFFQNREILISSWNVNGIRSVIKNNLDKLQNYLDTKKPHILCLNETKLDINSYSKEIKDLPVFS